MNIVAGQIVLIRPNASARRYIADDGLQVGVVVRINEDGKARCMMWTLRSRWTTPEDFDPKLISALPAKVDSFVAKRVEAARANIRRHHGFVPYGGTRTRYLRIAEEKFAS